MEALGGRVRLFVRPGARRAVRCGDPAAGRGRPSGAADEKVRWQGDRRNDFVAGRLRFEDLEGSAGALSPDLAALADSPYPYMRALQEETGAMLRGRRTFEIAGDADSYDDTGGFQVPIFVVTHASPRWLRGSGR